MKRKWIIYSGVGLIVIVGFIVILTNILANNEPSQEALSFCEGYPDALFCIDDEATEEEIVTDMFLTLLNTTDLDVTEEFCNAYFVGNLVEYCERTDDILFPTDFHLLNRNFTIDRVEEGIYDIYTTYVNYNDAYTFRIGVEHGLGVYEISGFSYMNTVVVEDIELTDEDINTFMVEMIEASDDDLVDYCDLYFTDLAQIECNINLDLVVGDVSVIENYVVTETNTNEYEYTVTNIDETSSITYTVLLKEVEGALRISTIDLT